MDTSNVIRESVEAPFGQATAAEIAKGILPVRFLVPGFSTSKKHYFSAQAVQDAVHILNGAKQYANHATREEEAQRPERSIRDWVATLQNTKVSDKGNAVGEAHIHSPWFKDMVQSLHEAGTLDKLGLSVNIHFKSSKQNIDGVDTFLIESLVDHPFNSVDFVTEPGAGGVAGIKESVSGLVLTQEQPDQWELRAKVRKAILAGIEEEQRNKPGTLADSFRQAHPEWTEKQIQIAAQGRGPNMSGLTWFND